MVPTLDMKFTEEYKEKLKTRIKEKTIITPEGCWEWQATFNKGKQNHGRIRLTNNGIRFVGLSHRVSYLIWKGDIPKGKYILHKCPNGGNSRCCNPDHLEIGDQKENCKDRKNDGNEYDRSGVKNGKSKLTESDVITIRDLHKNGLSYGEISKMYPVSRTHIGLIVKRKNWSEI